MVFDGIQYCATLPVAKKNVKGVEYYIWAIDDSFQSKRTRTYKMSLVPEAPCEYPVFDDDHGLMVQQRLLGEDGSGGENEREERSQGSYHLIVFVREPPPINETWATIWPLFCSSDQVPVTSSNTPVALGLIRDVRGGICCPLPVGIPPYVLTNSILLT